MRIVVASQDKPCKVTCVPTGGRTGGTQMPSVQRRPLPVWRTQVRLVIRYNLDADLPNRPKSASGRLLPFDFFHQRQRTGANDLF